MNAPCKLFEAMTVTENGKVLVNEDLTNRRSNEAPPITSLAPITESFANGHQIGIDSI